MRLTSAFAAFALLTTTALQALAQDRPPATAATTAASSFVSHHTGVFNGQKVKYLATVGETLLTTPDGAPALKLVSTSYVREGVKDAGRRPVIFLFNGGPSSASAWIRMGAFGPKRFAAPADLTAPISPPYRAVDNSYTVLDVADLVFVDPAETGFSRVLAGAKRADFYTSGGDARSVAQFVTAWLKANRREASPRYVLGESYGTLRAAIMAGELAKTQPLDGVILIGQAVNMIETSQRVANPVSYATNLPALAAIATYHRKAEAHGRSVAQIVDEAYAYGMGEYLDALMQGAALPADEQRKVAERLQALTGISADYYLAHRLAITKVDFRTELLKDKGLVLGMYDARYVGPADGPDPFGKVQDMVKPLLDEHMAKDLKVAWPMADYRMSAPETRGWVYEPTSGAGGPFNDFDYAEGLSKAFAAKPSFRLMIGTGIYDLTTTIGPARHLVAQSWFPKDRVVLHDYDGGHMAYSNEAALKALTDDVRAFVTARPQ